MLSFPVMTGNTGVDERIYAHLYRGALSQNLSEAETQHCVISFARLMLHSLGERKSRGGLMNGADFLNWLAASAQNHPKEFLKNYHPAVTEADNAEDADLDSPDFEISQGVSSKQDEIGFHAADSLMLSDFDGVLASAACQLAPSSRILIMWHYFGGLTVEEIGRIVGLGESDVRLRIVRAATELQIVLTRRGYARLRPEAYHPATNAPVTRPRTVFQS